MKEEDKSKLVEVFTGTPWEAELVKGILTASGIQVMVRDGILPNIILPAGATDVAIFVNEDDYAEAVKVIAEQEKNKDED